MTSSAKKSKSSRSSRKTKRKRGSTNTPHPRREVALAGMKDDWLEYRLANHPEFLRRIGEARDAIREGHGIPLDAIEP